MGKMTRVVIRVSVFASLLLAASAGLRAQHITFPNPPWWPGYIIYGHQDLPSYDPTPGPTTPIAFNRASDYFAGWAFLCVDGTQPTAITVEYHADDGSLHPLAVTVYQRLSRPDVYSAYIRACPNVTASEGYAIYFTDPSTVPLGVHAFSVLQSSDGNTVQMTDTFTLDVQ